MSESKYNGKEIEVAESLLALCQVVVRPSLCQAVVRPSLCQAVVPDLCQTLVLWRGEK